MRHQNEDLEQFLATSKCSVNNYQLSSVYQETITVTEPSVLRKDLYVKNPESGMMLISICSIAKQTNRLPLGPVGLYLQSRPSTYRFLSFSLDSLLPDNTILLISPPISSPLGPSLKFPYSNQGDL